MMFPDLARVTALTFDCYGTLIDWEAGAIGVLRPLLARHGVSLSDDEIVRAFQDVEEGLCEPPYRPYRVVLEGVVEGFGRRFGFPVGAAERGAAGGLAPGVAALPRHGRSVARPETSLPARDRLEHRRRPVRHHRPPARGGLRPRRDRRAGPLLQAAPADLRGGHPPPRAWRQSAIAHVAEGASEVPTARRLGCATVWVRRHGRSARLLTEAPDLEVPDLRSLAGPAGRRRLRPAVLDRWRRSLGRRRLRDEAFAHLFDEPVPGEAVSLDCETTGLDPRTAQILSVGAVRIRDDAILTSERLELLVRPTVPVPEETILVHHLRPCDVAGAPPVAEAMRRVLDFVGPRPLVGYYLEFDVALLERHVRPLLGTGLPNRPDRGLEPLLRLARPPAPGRRQHRPPVRHHPPHPRPATPPGPRRVRRRAARRDGLPAPEGWLAAAGVRAEPPLTRRRGARSRACLSGRARRGSPPPRPRRRSGRRGPRAWRGTRRRAARSAAPPLPWPAARSRAR